MHLFTQRPHPLARPALRPTGLLFAAAVAWSLAAHAQPAAEPSTTSLVSAPAEENAALIAAIESAIAAGDGGRLRRLCEAQPPHHSREADAALDTALARAWFLLGDGSRALVLARQAARFGSVPAAQWLAAEIHYARAEWGFGDTFRNALEHADPTSPAIPYLTARRLLARFADVDAGHVHPMMSAARQNLHASAAACTSLDARLHPHFDPRFLSLGIDAALFELDYELAAYHAIQLSALRPLNVPLARLALALAFDVPVRRDAFLDTLRTRSAFPSDELALWQTHAQLLDLTPEARKADAWLTLAEHAQRTPALVPVHVHLIARAVGRLQADDTRYAAAVRDYVDASLAARSPPHARVALRHVNQHPADNPAAREQRIALAHLAARHDLAAVLTAAEAHHHLDDFDWLARHRPIIARHQMPGVYASYLQAMEHLRPDDPVVLLQLARTLHHAGHSAALDYHHRAFAAATAQLTPTLDDWLAYRNLVRASDQRTRTADATKRFQAAIERIHAVAPNDLAAAHFYAHLLDLRASNTGSAADRAAAHAARAHAIGLSPEAAHIAEKLKEESTLITIQ